MLCWRRTAIRVPDENHLPDLTVGEFPPKSEIPEEKKGRTIIMQ